MKEVLIAAKNLLVLKITILNNVISGMNAARNHSRVTARTVKIIKEHIGEKYNVIHQGGAENLQIWGAEINYNSCIFLYGDSIQSLIEAANKKIEEYNSEINNIEITANNLPQAESIHKEIKELQEKVKSLFPSARLFERNSVLLGQINSFNSLYLRIDE